MYIAHSMKATQSAWILPIGHVTAYGGHLFDVDSNVLDSATWHERQSVIEYRSASDVLSWDSGFSGCVSQHDSRERKFS